MLCATEASAIRTQLWCLQSATETCGTLHRPAQASRTFVPIGLRDDASSVGTFHAAVNPSDLCLAAVWDSATAGMLSCGSFALMAWPDHAVVFGRTARLRLCRVLLKGGGSHRRISCPGTPRTVTSFLLLLQKVVCSLHGALAPYLCSSGRRTPARPLRCGNSVTIPTFAAYLLLSLCSEATCFCLVIKRLSTRNAAAERSNLVFVLDFGPAVLLHRVCCLPAVLLLSTELRERQALL